MFALAGDGELFGWGHNAYCQVGNGATAQVPTPAVISLGNLSVLNYFCKCKKATSHFTIYCRSFFVIIKACN